MEELQYKDFSLKTHQKNWHLKRPNFCQFELTFKCDFHCKYCYSGCFNRSEFIKKELSTKQVKFILDKLYEAGVIWLCFTGGDPLTRKDFLEIYDYAKQKGFIISVFTTAYSIDEGAVKYLREKPPFAIEITLNSIRKNTFETISARKETFDKSMYGIRLLAENKIPLKIKTMIIEDNKEELFEVKEFVESLGLSFRPDANIHARLDADVSACSLRIRPERVLEMDRLLCSTSLSFEQGNDGFQCKQEIRDNKYPFRCAAGSGDGIMIDPYGEMFFCCCLRKSSFSVFEYEIEDVQKLFFSMRQRTFEKDSRCRYCQLVDICNSCPGKAYLETGDLEVPVEWSCELAHLMAKEQNLVNSFSSF